MGGDSPSDGATRPLRFRPQPLWVRVDRNRAKIAWFVMVFVSGSALLLTAALVAVPGTLIGLAFASDQTLTSGWYWRDFGVTLLASLGILLAVGAIGAGVQLANAEDWVRNRFKGVQVAPGTYPALERAVGDMAIAAGLSQVPGIVVLDTPAVNAYALGTARSRAVIGVTSGLLAALPVAEQRAVAAALIARVVSGDILFATALAALMGPLKAIRGSGKAIASGGCASGGCADGGCASGGCGDALAGDGCSGLSDGCGCLFSGLDDADSAGSCLGIIGIGVFMAIVAAITYAAVVGAAWMVTLWGRLLHRTAYEKADAEGMLLLKDPQPMLAALQRAISSDTTISDGDLSYDGIFYTPTSGTARVERAESRRLRRLAEVLGVEGAVAVSAGDASQGRG